MSKTIRILVGLSLGALLTTVVSILVASSVFYKRGTEAAHESSTIASFKDVAAVTTSELTTAELALHNTASNCWMLINGNVYNLTMFLPLHPGGSITMTPYCGKDGTKAFVTKDKKPASSHSRSAESMLAQYFVAALGARITNGSSPVAGTTPTPSPKPASLLSSLVSSVQNAVSPLLGSSGSSASTVITTSSVSAHSTSSNCWIIVSGVSYNVTGYLTQHPGGVGVITPYCGKDATNAFATKDKGSAHSAYAYQQLATYAVGAIGSTTTASTPTSTLAPGVTATPTPSPAPWVAAPTPTPLPVAQSGYSTAQIATHNTSSNCWLIISGRVYDVTGYLTQHPGGVGVITPYCGKEATNAFNTKGGGGSAHSSYASSLLNAYFVGNVSGGTTATPTPTPTRAPGVTATPTPTPIPPAPTPTPLPVAQTGYTTADVAGHNTASNCWIIVSSKAYNVTSYLTAHPGGVSVITAYCGKEATSAFQTKGGRGSNHSTRAYTLLANYFVGNIITATQATPTPIPTAVPTTPPGQSTATPVPVAATATPVPVPATATPTRTPTPTQTSVNANCTRGVLPTAVSNKYPGATIRTQSIDNCSQELEINTSGGSCRHIKTNSSGAITSDSAC